MILGGSLLGLSLFLLPTTLLAQGVESLQLKPSVMIVVDSSGSMNWQTSGGDCDANNLACAANCAAYDAKDPDTQYPNDTERASYSNKSRYILAREALTGTYDPEHYFCCKRGTDSCNSKGIYDTPNSMPQLEDGILDLNSGTARFGLATFDTNKSTGGDSYGPEAGTNLGIKNESATNGRLVSVGLSDAAADILAVNATIQTVIEASLPSG
ncbi:MAG: hypothetical protein CO108_30610, partial [Deltaproteobacteria bacterium CG_4_9_14_3_um_filter_63_12]